MKFYSAALACLACLPASPLLAQMQIGGGICSSASLTGAYSLTLTGRDVAPTVTFSKISESIGTATFDGQNKVTFSLTTNTNQASGTSQTLSGTYSLQANCSGLLNLTTGDTASFTLQAFNNPTGNLSRNFLIAGNDGVYSFTGNGGLLPATCSTSLLSGVYAFNATGFALTTGAVSGINNISGLLQFDGKNAVTTTWYTSSGTTTTNTTTGQYSVASGCTSAASVMDPAGTTYALTFALTSADGANFLLSGASPTLMFTGSGRQATPATCSASTLTGTYSLVITGRNVNTSTALSQSYQGAGSATFDGKGDVTFLLTANTNLLQGVGQTLTGTYSLSSNCVGTLNISTGDSAAYTLITFNQGKSFTITGQDATYLLTGTGGPQPVSCLTSTLSGNYVLSGNGFALSSTTISGVNSVSGALQFDGRGAITGNWAIATNGASTTDTVSGHYSVNTACQSTATVTDQSGASWTLTFAITAVDGADFTVAAASPVTEFSANGHSAFTNPGVAIVNSASSVASGTPAGSIFALYGMNLAPSTSPATKVPLPGTLATTGVTVNGESAPLFYVGPGQINAQMPWDIQPGLASVVVTNAAGMSNTAAVMVPATAVPGIFPQYPTNAAVVASAANILITPQAPAHVGDTVVAYFTGGGPVNAAGPLVTGSYNPNGISPVTSTTNNSVTVAGVQAVVNYIGLTGSLVGVYQVNFVIPKVAAGTRNLVLTIGGVPSVVTTIPIAD